MEKIQLLRDPVVQPTNDVIKKTLGDVYLTYKEFVKKLSDNKLEIEWRYYNDGKAWLGKSQHKNKTVFWFSVWEDFFMLTFYFTEKTLDGLLKLEISDDIKEKMKNSKPIGKLVPLILKVKLEWQFKDIFAVIDYKKRLK